MSGIAKRKEGEKICIHIEIVYSKILKFHSFFLIKICRQLHSKDSIEDGPRENDRAI